MIAPGEVMRSAFPAVLLMAAMCAASFVSSAQSRTAVYVYGPDLSLRQAAEAALSATPDVLTSDSSLTASVLSLLRTAGYYRARVDSVQLDSSTVQLWVTEGKRTVVDTLSLPGVPPDLYDAVLSSMELRNGGVFVEEVLERDMDEIVRVFGEQGYLNAMAGVEPMREFEDDEEYRLSFDIRVRPGERTRVDTALFEGLVVTRARTATVLSGLERGSEWSSRAGESARRRLNRLGIFSDISEPGLTLTGPGGVRVVFTVREGKPNSFDGIIGYLPPPVGAKTGTVTGLIDLRFRNLFGTARQLRARWFQERQSRHEIGVNYREPSIAGWLVSGELDLFQRRQDSSYVRFDASLGFDAEVGADMFAGVELSTSGTTPVEGYGRTVLPQSTTTFAGARFAYDTRDRPVATRSGVLYATSLRAGRKRSDFNGITGATGVQNITFDAGFYYPAFRYQTLVLAAHWREVTGDGLDEADLYRLGGSATLRGYRENEFAGTRLMWQTTEYRFFLSPDSFLGGFLDIASIRTGGVTGGGPSRSFFRAGYGITSLVQTPVGAVGVSIAMGEGDGVGDAKLHVRLRTEF